MQSDKNNVLQQEIKVVNIGLEMFADALRQQKAQVVHVDFRPPADGDPELLGILDQLL